ncbi:hypothetical protein Vretifemale_11821, partial [Volvox reticuliferus]
VMFHAAMLLRAARFRVAGGGIDDNSRPNLGAVSSGLPTFLTTVIATVRSMLSALPASPLFIYLMPLLASLIFPAVHVPKWVASAESATAANATSGAATRTSLSRTPTGSQCKQSRQQQPQQRLSTLNPADLHSASDRLHRGGGICGLGGGGGSSWLTSPARFSTSCPGMDATAAAAAAAPVAAAPFAAIGRTRDRYARARAPLASLSAGPCPSRALPNTGNGGYLKSCGGASGVGVGVCVRVNGGGSGNGIAVIRRLLVDGLASSGQVGVSDPGGNTPERLLSAPKRTRTVIETVTAASEPRPETGTAQSVIEDELNRRTLSAPAHGCIGLPPPRRFPLQVLPQYIAHSPE